jgi:hypothetical protein
MEVGAPNSEPGSSREGFEVSSSLRGGTRGSDLLTASDTLAGFDGIRAETPANWLSEGARESRGARPGLR